MGARAPLSPRRPGGFDPVPLTIGSIANGKTLGVNPRVAHGRVYDRALYTTELIGNWRHGLAHGF